MQLDQAHVAIRERTWLENLDLALHVARAYLPSLAVCAVVGILPLAVFNHWLTTPGDYWLVLLVMIEAPLATAPITLYLGQALFLDQPRAGRVARDFCGSLPQLLLLQVALRTVLIVPLVTWFVPYVLHPYLNEVIFDRQPQRLAAPRQAR